MPLSLSAPSQLHHTDTPHIWISPSLDLPPGTSIAAALGAPFDAPFTVTLDKPDQGQTRTLRSCNDYLPVETAITSASSAIDLRSLRYLGTRCDALALLLRAKPASRQGLKNFSWKHVTVRELPPQLALALSPDQIARANRVAARKGSIRTLDPTVRLRPLNATQTRLDAKEWTATLTLYAHADFTGTGEDSLLIRRDAFAKRGTYAVSSLSLLARDRTTGQLSVIEAQP